MVFRIKEYFNVLNTTRLKRIQFGNYVMEFPRYIHTYIMYIYVINMNKLNYDIYLVLKLF